MIKSFTFECPDHVFVNNKKIFLNLNSYRNLHYAVNNQAKSEFKRLIKEQLDECPVFENEVCIRFKIIREYRKSKKLIDKSNVYSVVTKYLYDAITEDKKWIDDNDDYIKLEQILPTIYKQKNKGDLKNIIKVTITEVK